MSALPAFSDSSSSSSSNESSEPPPRHPSLLRACFGCAGRADSGPKTPANTGDSVLNTGDQASRLASCIQRGDVGSVERILKKQRHPQELLVSVKRRHLNPNFNQWTSGDPFLHFHQECSPVLWAMDCQQWNMLPLFARYGLDPNRPLYCRRWTILCAPNTSRPNASPYKGFWTRGKFTYQSALDYFFASIYEFLAEDMQRLNPAGASHASPFTYYFQQLPVVLSKSVDVHRIDSVMIFNSLAFSFDWFLSRYTNESCTVPDIPESSSESFIEMKAVRSLIRHGFSQFECMEFISSCHSWFGLLFCLLCHPKLEEFGETRLPPIIRAASLLLINLLAQRCHYHAQGGAEELFEENLESLQLRKLYVKRYTERRHEFSERLRLVQQACVDFQHQPQSLRMLTRAQLRVSLGGVNFKKKLRALPVPKEMAQFVAYMEEEHMKYGLFPGRLVRLARGENIYSTETSA